ncbi:CapA family protein [Legionella longbeachae]|uniref:Putative capsule biosynthesis protein n=1 Tax=Legionella longbeachae serogroup 1 (strain NSW150) TaxID=661367 RepID=D3HRZ3_LEGLN|nr:CapA family protein [Legionella longbeachae]VEE02174.1 capsule biosynthesis protein [Legionella oakridgensis]ARB91524.1 CapA family protein [Legionella longbeachae]EEZ95199.1 putative capsule biosynthesis protein CapA [Legionella longbeachae D-4968]QIN32055.1 CapA family protein [Legionella longbeachae]QIN35401.1 CapA family protein [Legionella longbeachae]
MKKRIVILFVLLVFFMVYYHLHSIPTKQNNFQELALSGRPSWAQWRSEGKGVLKYFLHFFDYQKKATLMVLNPFPGQTAFFAHQKTLLAKLPQPSSEESFIRVGLVGDLMAIPNYDGQFIAPQILNLLAQMDFVLGNLETPVSSSGTISKFRNSLSQFNVSDNYLNALTLNGKPVFDFLSLANNHVLDRGDLGVQETREELKSRGIITHGTDQQKFISYTTKGIHFGVAAATWGTNPQFSKNTTPIWYLPGIAPLDINKVELDQLINALHEMKQANVDFKILFLHWGFEYELYPDPLIQSIGSELIQNGADLIIGSHPHVLQPFELIQASEHKGLIAYSMGNFISDMSNPFTRIGLIQELYVWRNSQQRIQWALGSSKLTQIADIKHPYTELLRNPPPKDLSDAYVYYKHSLNLPFLVWN